MTPRQLLYRLSFDRAFVETARIIGYDGVTLAAFWEQAKQLGIPDGQLLNAVYDLTRGDKREEARYELSGPARDACWQLLGPPPGHPLREEIDRLKDPPEIHAEKMQTEIHAEKMQNPRKPRGKGR